MRGSSLVKMTGDDNSAGDTVYMYGHTYSKSMDQPGKVANPGRGQLNRENEYFPVRVVCAFRIRSRETG